MDAQRSDLTEAADSLGRIIRETDKKIRSDFQNTFQLIQTHFKTVFSELFGGGTAQLSVRGDDMLEAEIDIIAQPPGEKLQNMNLLSGGEKTMTAIALMFAVLKAKPAPFCISTRWRRLWTRRISKGFPLIWKISRGVQFRSGDSPKGYDGTRRRTLRCHDAGEGNFESSLVEALRRKTDRGQCPIDNLTDR